jgi:alpha-tubulin suppressor-like RCC1 family protein
MGRHKILFAGLIIVSSCGVPVLAASAATPRPKIMSFYPTTATVGTQVTIEGTDLAGATRVTFNGNAATIISSRANRITADAPVATTTGYIKVKSAGVWTRSASKFNVLTPLDGVMSVAGDGRGYCALLTASEVNCWGYGDQGQLGNGVYYPNGGGSATPVSVEGVGGAGTLTGATNIVSAGSYGGYCALLSSGGVDCWGDGQFGQLGNGKFYEKRHGGRASPVAVEGVGGSGTLTGVTNLFSDQDATVCALLSSGALVCWGAGFAGQLGDGTSSDSAVPVVVDGVGGIGTLMGVTSMSGGGLPGGGDFCALLTSGEVDCWGNGSDGELGNGMFSGSSSPVAVQGVGGSGTLTGVTSVVSNSAGYCALLSSGGVDCWGFGQDGELGNGTFYTSAPYGSATTVAVEGVGGTGTLTGVTSVVEDAASGSGPSGGGPGYCALLTSGGVDCWGAGPVGELGNGASNDSASPVTVEGVGGTGTLTGVMSLANDAFYSYCALLTSGGVDCWGAQYSGVLGNGTASQSQHSTVPVAVEGVGGNGTLTAVASLIGGGADGPTFCALLTSSGLDCWGGGYNGVLGNGTFSHAVSPVEVG